MALAITLAELLRYTAEEREKWRAWFSLHPAAMELPIHPGGRFPTAGKLVDHIFLVEQRHLQRLTGRPLAEATGLTGSNAAPLFDYGSSVRREIEQYLADLDEDLAQEPRAFEVRGSAYEMTPRKLLFHMVLHEIRHWAQIALAARQGGLAPPGDHDLFYSAALK